MSFIIEHAGGKLYTEIGNNDSHQNTTQAPPSRIIFDTLKKGMLNAIEIIKHLQDKLLENSIKEKTKEDNDALLSQNKTLLDILNFLCSNYSSNDLIKGDIKKLRENINQLSK